MRVRVIGFGVLLAATLIVSGERGTRAEPPPRPNVVVILVDDLRWDELGSTGHPFAKTPNIDRVAREGALFRNAFVTTPLCSPSRASFLTGQYAHTHGITDNTDRSAASHQLVTFPLLLHRAGYETAFIGKWHMGNDDSARPGFDRWVSFKGQGTYLDPDINEDGKARRVPGYITDILNDHAASFIKRPRRAPFLLYLAHKALHPEVTQNNDGTIDLAAAERFIPAERHRALYADRVMPRRPNAMRPPQDKPALRRQIGDLPALGATTGTRDEVMRARLQTLMAVDDGVGKIFEALAETGQLDRTIIVVAGDNGYFYGEHGLSVERRLAYEESIRMPLLVRYPAVVRRPRQLDQLVLNLDLAPTVLTLAGVPVPGDMQGRPLVPLLSGERPAWRDSFLVEYFSDTVFPRILKMGYTAIRTHRWKYIRYLELEGMDEIYDLGVDPYEMRNLIDEPAARPALERMRTELRRLLKDSGTLPSRPGASSRPPGQATRRVHPPGVIGCFG